MDQSPQIGRSWDGRLDDWLAALLGADAYSQDPTHIQTWSFPTDELRDAYLHNVGQRDEHEVMHLLRRFLFDATTFGADKRNAEWVLSQLDGSGPDIKWNSEYERRVVLSTTGTIEAHAGIRWVLDLLPSSPRLAIDSISAYKRAHIQHLPDGRLVGLEDAQTLIHAYFIGRSTDDAQEALRGISPRELEVLTARLYEAMGYAVEVTPPGRDGGRDVLAREERIGRQQLALIECKHYVAPVSVKPVRELLGVVSHGRASRGVVVCTGRFTRGARKEANATDRIELVDGAALVALLNEHFSPNWPSRLDFLLRFPAFE